MFGAAQTVNVLTKMMCMWLVALASLQIIFNLTHTYGTFNFPYRPISSVDHYVWKLEAPLGAGDVIAWRTRRGYCGRRLQR